MTDYTELKRLAEGAVHAGDHRGLRDSFERQLAKLVSPETVLALIAENERLKTLRSTTERDLAQELEVWRNGPSCWNCGDTGDVHDMVGEWRGQCDCNAAKLIDVSSERDQLKAENEIFEEGMRSLASTLGAGGYNAEKLTAQQLIDKVQWGLSNLSSGWEVLAEVSIKKRDELKAENDELRKIISDSATSCGAAVSVECSLDFMGHLPVEIFSVISKLRNALAECADSLHGEMLQKFGGQLPDDMHPVTRREYDRDMAEVAGYRAAMGKGEQS